MDLVMGLLVLLMMALTAMCLGCIMVIMVALALDLEWLEDVANSVMKWSVIVCSGAMALVVICGVIGRYLP